jgi:Na+/melibiose symporter-like transporter
MGIIFAMVSALPLLLVFFGTREREEYMHQEQPTLRQSLRVALRNKPFLFALGIAIPAMLWLLHFTGYDGLAEQQRDSALLGLRLVIGPIPALLLCLGIVLAFLYPLTRRKHAEVVSELERRRSATPEEEA